MDLIGVKNSSQKLYRRIHNKPNLKLLHVCRVSVAIPKDPKDSIEITIARVGLKPRVDFFFRYLNTRIVALLTEKMVGVKPQLGHLKLIVVVPQ